MLKQKFNTLWMVLLIMFFGAATAFAQNKPTQNKLVCPYSVVNYLDRNICFNYEVRGSSYGQDCKTLYEGFACIPKSEDGQPSYWNLDTLCESASDIVITIKTCGGCTLNPRITVSGHCEEARKDSSHTPCCRMLRMQWDRKETRLH